MSQPIVVHTRKVLPYARSPAIASDVVVRLQTDLSLHRRLDLAFSTPISGNLTGEKRPAQLYLNEYLSVKGTGCGVERRSRNRLVNVVGGRDGVAIARTAGQHMVI